MASPGCIPGAMYGSVEGVFLMADAQAIGFPIRYASPGFEQVYGYSAAEIVGRKCGDLIGGPAIASSMESLASLATAVSCPLQEADARIRFLIAKAGEACRVMMANPGTRVGVALLANRKKSGALFVCECLVLNLKHPTLNWSYCVGFQRDISSEVPLRTLLANASEDAYARLLQTRSAAIESRRAALLGVGGENIMRYLHEKAMDVFSMDIWRTLRSELITSVQPSAADRGSVACPAVSAPVAPTAGHRAVPTAATGASAPPTVAVREAVPSVAVAPAGQRAIFKAGAPSPVRSISGSSTSSLGTVSITAKALAKRSPMQEVRDAALVPDAPCLDLQVPAAAPQALAPRVTASSAVGQRLLGDSYQDVLMTNSVVEFLADVGLQRYAETLLVNGFDDMETLVGMTDDDMKDLGLPRGHAMKLRRCLRAFECLQICCASGGKSAPRQLEDAPAAPSNGSSAVPSAEETNAVQRSWARVEEFGTARFGEILFSEFFEQDPQALALFPPEVCEKYWDWSADATTSSSSRAPVAPQLYTKITNMIGGAVVGLHDAQSLVPSLVRLGARHCAYGVRQEHFGLLAKGLTGTLQKCLGEEFTPEVELAWSVVFNFVTATMVGGMQAAQALALTQGPEQEPSRDQPEETGTVRSSSDGGEGPTLLRKAHAGQKAFAQRKNSDPAKRPF
mmetsp:Transcript_40940/g.108205  ORF Transcript_40940/g.108205 Transcript_40940/m.108205 type:complete len:681 (+) Transcript_40940:76-2118(+)